MSTMEKIKYTIPLEYAEGLENGMYNSRGQKMKLQDMISTLQRQVCTGELGA